MNLQRLLLPAVVGLFLASCAPMNERCRSYTYGPAYNNNGQLCPRPSYSADYGYPSYCAPAYHQQEVYHQAAAEGYGNPCDHWHPFTCDYPRPHWHTF